MKLVILESPYAGDVAENLRYGRACIRDSLLRGEAPIASHLLYTQPGILNDDLWEERQAGIAAGLAWGCVAQLTAVYTDRGISSGMEYGRTRAVADGRPVEFRTLGAAWGPPDTLPLIDILRACDSDAARADWLLRCPLDILRAFSRTIRAICQQAGFAAGADYVAAEGVGLWATRHPDGKTKAGIQIMLDSSREALMAAVEKNTGEMT